MGNPKRRFSKARTRSRRANWKVAPVQIAECPHCHEPKLNHRVCGNCGYYAGKEMVKASSETN
ncbi:MAG: 50S ribosomal protein L32 [Limnochordia bacterium]